MARESVHPAVPRGKRLLACRKAPGEVEPSAAWINRVSVVRLDGAPDAALGEEVDDFVQPREIVCAAHFLALRPAALEPRQLDAERRHVVAILAEVDEIAVKGLAAYHPVGRLDFRGGTRADRADSLEANLRAVCRRRKGGHNYHRKNVRSHGYLAYFTVAGAQRRKPVCLLPFSGAL